MPGTSGKNFHNIFEIKSESEFVQSALDVFKFQYNENGVYREFCKGLGRHPGNVGYLEEIPFLPVEVFKSHKIVTGDVEPEIIFSSSSTTGKGQSFHYVKDLGAYEESFFKTFKRFYGPPGGIVLLALLPSYLERKGSSLVYMAQKLIGKAADGSGFFLHDYKGIAQKLTELEKAGQKTILLGVSYALLDLAEQFPIHLSNTIIMETGGMKGKRKELLREELHGILKNAFKVTEIHSEYGMAEMLSQAYSKGEGVFYCPPWVKVLVREADDPFTFLPSGRNGGINIIDLANLYSCSFLSTQDLGKTHPDGSFEVSGRFDNSDIRGCNLLVG